MYFVYVQRYSHQEPPSTPIRSSSTLSCPTITDLRPSMITGRAPHSQDRCTWPGSARRGRGRPGCWTPRRWWGCTWGSWRAAAWQTPPRTRRRAPASRWWPRKQCRRRPGWTTWLRLRRRWWCPWRWGCAARPAGSRPGTPAGTPLGHGPPGRGLHGRAPGPCIGAPGSSCFIHPHRPLAPPAATPGTAGSVRGAGSGSLTACWEETGSEEEIKRRQARWFAEDRRDRPFPPTEINRS